MPGADLEMMALEMWAKASAECVRCGRLTDGADIVLVAFYRQQRRLGDLAWINAAATISACRTLVMAGTVSTVRRVSGTRLSR